MTKRRLEVGPDGKANVMVLTDPIPRHLSIVGWGANDTPARSWKSATSPNEVLRSPPSKDVIDVGNVSVQRVQHFIAETFDALHATVADVLRTPLSSAERGSRVQGLWADAGARIAAFATAVSAPKLAEATKSYKTVGLEFPKPPESSTLQGEIDRRYFMAGMEHATAAATDRVLSIMRDSGEFPSMTEGILSTFHEAAIAFASWAASMPSGVVGVASDSPKATQNAGSRNSKADQNRLNKIMALLAELGAETPSDSEKSIMTITVADLQRIANEDPVGLLTALKTAVDNAKASAPEVAKKFMWGETGVTPHTEQEILSMLTDMSQSGDALASLIAQAVGNVDVGSRAEMDNVQVAASMRAALSKHVAAELETNPSGDLATSVKSILAPSVAAAVKESLKALLNGKNSQSVSDASAPFGMDGFTVPDDQDPLEVEYPSANALFNR